jgi:hypothetical protein
MKIKLVGFKVGTARPTCNKTIDPAKSERSYYDLGEAICIALQKSDFLSIRRIE